MLVESLIPRWPDRALVSAGLAGEVSPQALLEALQEHTFGAITREGTWVQVDRIYPNSGLLAGREEVVCETEAEAEALVSALRKMRETR